MNEAETVTRFADAEGAEDIQYRGVSKIALLALVLGIASLLALAHLLLCVIPVMAIVLALFAMWSISRNESLVGRKAALFAIGLAMFSIGWSVTRDVSRRHTLYSESEQHARDWLQLVIGAKNDLSKLHEAFQLHQPPAARLPKGTNWLAHVGTLEAAPDGHTEDEFSESQQFRGMFGREPLKTIIDLGPDATLHFDGTLRTTHAKIDYVSQQFTITYKNETGEQRLPIVVEMRRQYEDSENAGTWWMADIETLENYVGAASN